MVPVPSTLFFLIIRKENILGGTGTTPPVQFERCVRMSHGSLGLYGSGRPGLYKLRPPTPQPRLNIGKEGGCCVRLDVACGGLLGQDGRVWPLLQQSPEAGLLADTEDAGGGSAAASMRRVADV